MKKILVLILCLGLFGCATTSKITNRLSLGMTQEEVRKNCGNPFKKEAREGQEIWYYQEQVWLETGYPTLLMTEVYFKDNKVAEFKQGKEPSRQPHHIEQRQYQINQTPR